MKKLLSLALGAVLAISLLAAPAMAYSDVDGGAWYAAAVDYCADKGLMDGMGGGVFAPAGAVTRAQLITTLWRLAGKPYVGEGHGFTDVPADAWYDAALRWARHEGVTDGMGDGSFAPDAPLTREQLVVFFHRFAGEPGAQPADFADGADIADWAQTAAGWALESGLMQGKGDGRFDPKGGAVRAELAQVLKNFDGRTAAAVPTLAADAARMAPVGIAYDLDGAAIVTDEANKVVWRIDGDSREVLAGAVYVVDGSGTALGGYYDGPAAAAWFASPWGVAPFMEGWAVSDPDNNTVRYIHDGHVTTLNGIDFDMPTGLAAGADGVLYVANTAAGTVLRVTTTGASSVVASGLAGPTGLAWADGKLYICETDANRVLVLPDGGTAEVLAGDEEGGFADGAARAEARFTAPQGVVVGPDGAVYIADTGNSAVRCLSGGAVTTLLAQPEGIMSSWTPAAPVGMALSGGMLTVCDRLAGTLIAAEVG